MGVKAFKDLCMKSLYLDGLWAVKLKKRKQQLVNGSDQASLASGNGDIGD